MIEPLGPVLFAAVHKGPYLSIQPLEAELSPENTLYLVDGISKSERANEGLPFLEPIGLLDQWGSVEDFLEANNVRAVVRSSSEDVMETNVEDWASAAAKTVGTPVFVVEDFPGNFQPNERHRLDALFVEDPSLCQLHQSRGVDPNVIFSTGNPRYSQLAQMDRASSRRRTRSQLGLSDETVLLWAGQPDGNNSYFALQRLLSHFARPGVTIMFRAHPRDELYASGGYNKILEESPMPVIDTTRDPYAFQLYCAADLVATQFSSAGVEASHLGVPAMFALFDDLGKEYLRSYKGYEQLPWCLRRDDV